VIYHLRRVRLSVREIARGLDRRHSTISRELKRNGARYPGAVVLGAERAKSVHSSEDNGTRSS
jgi:IS30 family transposase